MIDIHNKLPPNERNKAANNLLHYERMVIILSQHDFVFFIESLQIYNCLPVNLIKYLCLTA